MRLSAGLRRFGLMDVYQTVRSHFTLNASRQYGTQSQMSCRQLVLILPIFTVCLLAGCASKTWAPDAFSESNIQKLREAVVEIRGYGVGRCSGAFVRPGIILTASHCAYSGLNFEFSQYKDQDRFFAADVIYHNPKDDISILRTRDSFQSAYLEIEENLVDLTDTETVATMGHPDKREDLADWFRFFPHHMYWLSTGKMIVSYDNKIYADIKVDSGSSGGPLLNENGKIVGVTSALGLNPLDPFSFDLVGIFVSKNRLDEVRDRIAAPDIDSAPPLPWTAAESNLYSSVGVGIRNNLYSTMTWIPTINLGYNYAGRMDFAVGTTPFFGTEFGWLHERLRFYLPFSNGLTSFRIGAGVVCQQTKFFNGYNTDPSSCLPELSVGIPLLDLGLQLGANDPFIKIMLEIRIMRWLSSLGY